VVGKRVGGSIKRDAFRNRLRNSSIMSSTAGIVGRERDKDSVSVSSRFVIKLDGLQMESDIISQ